MASWNPMNTAGQALGDALAASPWLLDAVARGRATQMNQKSEVAARYGEQPGQTGPIGDAMGMVRNAIRGVENADIDLVSPLAGLAGGAYENTVMGMGETGRQIGMSLDKSFRPGGMYENTPAAAQVPIHMMDSLAFPESDGAALLSALSVAPAVKAATALKPVDVTPLITAARAKSVGPTWIKQSAELKKLGVDTAGWKPADVQKLFAKYTGDAAKASKARVSVKEGDRILASGGGTPITKAGSPLKASSTVKPKAQPSGTAAPATEAATGTAEAAAKPGILARNKGVLGLGGIASGLGYALTRNPGISTAEANKEGAGINLDGGTSTPTAAPTAGANLVPTSGGATQGPQIQGGAPVGSDMEQMMNWIDSRMPQDKEKNMMEKIGEMLLNTGQALQGNDPRAAQRLSDTPNRTPDEQMMQSIIPQLMAFYTMKGAQNSMSPSHIDAARIRKLDAETNIYNTGQQY